MKRTQNLGALGALAIFLSAAAVSGCNGTDAGSAAPAPGSADGNPTSGVTQTGGGGSSNVAVGESCQTGDAGHLCLAIHFVTYTQNGVPTATSVQAATIVHEMNTLWAQCGIGFQIENYEQVDPTTVGLSYGAQSQNELTQIRSAFQDPQNELLAVTTGPWGTSVNAWTQMPGGAPYGAVMEASIVTYANGIIYGHEFGHYLGLDHVSDNSNLMSPLIYTTSTALTNSQCQTAQDTAKNYWAGMLR